MAACQVSCGMNVSCGTNELNKACSTTTSSCAWKTAQMQTGVFVSASQLCGGMALCLALDRGLSLLLRERTVWQHKWPLDGIFTLPTAMTLQVHHKQCNVPHCGLGSTSTAASTAFCCAVCAPAVLLASARRPPCPIGHRSRWHSPFWRCHASCLPSPFQPASTMALRPATQCLTGAVVRQRTLLDARSRRHNFGCGRALPAFCRRSYSYAALPVQDDHLDQVRALGSPLVRTVSQPGD